MTLEEAIKHCEEIAELKYDEGNEARLQEQDKYADECIACAAEHRQLAEWLRELKAVHDEIDDADDEDEIFIGYLRKKMRDIPDTNVGKMNNKKLSETQKPLDTISRQAAIDAILDVTGNSSVRELYEHVQEHGLSDMWSGGVNAAIDIIIAVPSVQPEQQWIPCSERLPDKEGTYLVTDDAGGVIYIHDDGFFYCDDEKPTWLLSQNAKAWMPLPEPYREDEG